MGWTKNTTKRPVLSLLRNLISHIIVDIHANQGLSFNTQYVIKVICLDRDRSILRYINETTIWIFLSGYTYIPHSWSNGTIGVQISNERQQIHNECQRSRDFDLEQFYFARALRLPLVTG